MPTPFNEYTADYICIIKGEVNKIENNNNTTVVVNNSSNQPNGMATTALVMGIIGVVLGIIPIIGWFFLPLWILAIIFGVLGLKKVEKRGFAIAGVALGVGTFLYKIGFWLVLGLLSI